LGNGRRFLFGDTTGLHSLSKVGVIGTLLSRRTGRQGVQLFIVDGVPECLVEGIVIEFAREQQTILFKAFQDITDCIPTPKGELFPPGPVGHVYPMSVFDGLAFQRAKQKMDLL
jgi:hypothetical protein